VTQPLVSDEQLLGPEVSGCAYLYGGSMPNYSQWGVADLDLYYLQTAIILAAILM
jgi:hypothetical protein